MVRRLAKRVLEQIAQRVSKNELFEQPGDRATQPTLSEGAWKGAKGDGEESGG